MAQFEKFTPPAEGERITIDENGKLQVPNNPIVPFIEGDGTGRIFGAPLSACWMLP